MSQQVGIDANRIIRLAAKDATILGVGQTLSGEDLQDCFDTLNMMLDEWSEQRPCVYQLADVNFACDGSQSYTVGPGGKINLSYVPIRIDSAIFTNNGVNYPLRVVHAKEDFRRIALPTLTSFPEYIFLDTGWPLASISVWPIPNNTYTVTMQVMLPLTEFVYLTDVVNLRPVYRAALRYNLAERIGPMFGVEIPPTVLRLAASTKRSMERANIQIPMLQMPRDLLRRGHYNVFSDRLT
ncbi:hypothetical protein ACPCHQ_17055 [Ralstonia thomasii]|jgi:hypothetical protein|uniref:Uncharacterized protein n=2 Tax=Ralstonia TaxID=48736 RepID=A0ABM9JWK0_9RALS|nr:MULTISPECIES: hypothetical protein [Ralstonia]MBT2181015.1 hypothetical protein [Ralstonia pickettii]CAJ0710704.1 hypothetical protein LMG7143_01695 [Ralstonia sp. LMG 18095]CAJ0806255.1 hypothetical protein LMG18095_04410 [Ralstonia sp. LMG 18095]